MSDQQHESDPRDDERDEDESEQRQVRRAPRDRQIKHPRRDR
jgi:hypothetical protein